jgi:hypothetical protein
MATVESTPAILREAADLFDELEWVQQYFAINLDGERCSVLRSDVAAVCATGAIFLATAADPTVCELDHRGPASAAVRAIERHLRLDENGVLRPNNLSDWNDSPKRTKAEVVANLRAAADQYSGKS